MEPGSARHAAWGGLILLVAPFRHQSRWLGHTRKLIDEMCSDHLACQDATQQLVTAAQELLENLVKYSSGERAQFRFELALIDGQPRARIQTHNRAAPEQLEDACEILSRIVGASDPRALYEAMVAQSGEGKGSRLGLARLRADAGLELTFAVEGNCLALEASCAVQPRPDRPDSEL